VVPANGTQTTAASGQHGYRVDPRAYIRIAAMLHNRISAGDLSPGHATPSITRLCADYGVARETAAHALHVLQDAGLIYRVPGLGYYVCVGGLSRTACTANGLRSLLPGMPAEH
jgi:DNA-binding GntR family transcriptional regulator